jgi:hypothetical protein
VLLWIFVLLPNILRDPKRRWLLVSVVFLYAGIMMFHASGNVQRGYNRFSLDYVPVLMAIIAPYAVDGWRKWVTLTLVFWSVVYFTRVA